MIQIHKRSSAPAKFVKASTERTERDCQAYEAHSHEYRNGTKKFEFEQKFYGHQAIKEALKTDQYGKCCFCEGKFEAHASGDVEHYRPKGAVKQRKDSEALYPGYYWLAYSWKNLYYSCNICNSTKGSFFPLADPALRARSHTDDLAREKPLILDPGGPDDPREHIRFQDEIAESKTLRGRTTIDLAGLNRQTLIDARLIYLNKIRCLAKIQQHLPEIHQLLGGLSDAKAIEIQDEARSELEAAVEPTAQFSAMTADFLA